jgi:DNA-binding MarR family transcriptional regulator
MRTGQTSAAGRGRAPAGVQRDLRQRKPFRSLAQEGTVALLKTAAVIDRALTQVLAPAGLSHEQYNVLRILRGAPDPLPTLEIRRRMIAEGAAITRLLDKLEAAGFVRRERPASSRRHVLCAITPAGRQLLARVDDAVNDTDERAMHVLSDAELRTLVSLLDRVRADVRSGRA